MRLVSVNKLWERAKHNAFTDLCEFNQQVFCCFREAHNHVSADGKIRILRLNKHGGVSGQYQLMLTNIDLRDPKLSVSADGQLLLIAYARHTDLQNRTLDAQPICWLSPDGHSWSSHRFFGDHHWWLWRLRWHQQKAYGFAYNRAQQALHFYSGHPRRTFHQHKAQVLSLAKHGLGYPNESDLLFTQDEKCYAIVRRDADTFSAQLGVARPPYKQWQWHDLGEHIGAPCMLKMNDKQVLVGGRLFQRGSPKTALWQVDLTSKTLKLLHILPSAGDTSYPGLVHTNGQIWLSYYSSHAGKSKIYLAKFTFS